MFITNTARIALLNSCDTLQRRTCPAGKEYMHSSAKCFDACMRAFDRKNSPVEAICFRIWLNTPVNKAGFAKIYKDGHMEMCTGDEPQFLDN